MGQFAHFVSDFMCLRRKSEVGTRAGEFARMTRGIKQTSVADWRVERAGFGLACRFRVGQRDCSDELSVRRMAIPAAGTGQALKSAVWPK